MTKPISRPIPQPIFRQFSLKGIQAYCSIGIHEFEKQAVQLVTIDIDARLDLSCEPQEDRIEAVLNYDDMRKIVIETATSRHFNLQETLARAIFDRLASMPSIIGLRVRTNKPDIYEDVDEAAYQLSSFA